jgi:parvulin-like peptidyl-prolyl isomerase
MSKRISASHILIMHKDSQSSRSSLTKDQALKLVNKLRDDLSKNPEKFKDIAVQKSDCASASNGGSLGEFGEGMMVKEFEVAAFSLEVNQISDLVETDFGFHIIKRDK